MTNKPIVSVVMPVYNGERFLDEAIDSILTQTFDAFEFIIIDDGSTDRTPEILTHYQQKDARIRVHRQATNLGLVAALNQGCGMAQGRYIARMDADDISLPMRFAKQVAYLDAHPEVGILGTGAQIIDEHGKLSKIIKVTAIGVGWRTLFGSALVHPSVMMRRAVLNRIGGYDPEINLAQDYDLWTRASRVTRLANLCNVLLQYRVWDSSISGQRAQHQEQAAQKLIRRNIAYWLGIDASENTVAIMRHVHNRAWGTRPANISQIRQTAALIHQLYRRYSKKKQPAANERRMISRDVARKLHLLAIYAFKLSPGVSIRLILTALRISPISPIILGLNKLRG